MDHISQETKKFGETTTIRGVPRIVKSKDVFLKVVWSFAVLTCTVVLIALLVTLFQKFYQWPVSSRFGEDSKVNIVFPDITICSLNRFVNNLNDDNETTLTNYFETMSQLTKLNITIYYKLAYDIFNSLTGLIINLKKENMTMEDCPSFIADCMLYSDNWQEEAFCHDNFSERWNGEYFSCQTLKTSLLKIDGNKVVRGISLILNIGPPNVEQLPYDLSLTSSQAYGAVLSIHGSGSEPDLKKGFTVAPGTESVVKIQQTNIERLDKPHNPQGCTLQKNLSDSPNAAFTKDLCQEHCQQNAIFKECNCVVHWYDIPDSLKDAPICGNASEAMTLINNFTMKMICSFLVEVQKCDQCKLPCREIDYQYTVSSAPWPPVNFLLSVYRKYVKDCMDDFESVKERYAIYDYFDQILMNSSKLNSTEFKNKLPDMKQISESMMVVKLVIEDDYPLLLQEKPAYTWDVMISLVGGMLSLWLGISAMTVIELLELFYHIIKGCSKKSNSNSTSRC